MSEQDPRVLIEVRGLEIDRPDGAPLLRGVELELRAGEIVALLGGSGAGKSTLVTALHDRDALEANGFGVRAEVLERHAGVGIVPQRGALFDHLDVAGNLALAMRNAYPPRQVSAGALQDALASVDLPTSWAGSESRGVARLSGGEAQRLAVARTLAGGRRILFLDEPSVGLDPLRVEGLADLLRGEILERKAAALVITHELEFAAGFADRFWFMDRSNHAIVELDPLASVAPDRRAEAREAMRSAQRPRALRREVAAGIGDQMIERLAAEASPAPGPRPGLLARMGAGVLAAARRGLAAALGGLEVGPRVAMQAVRAALSPRDFLEVIHPVLKQALWRPAAFFSIVSLLIGFTLLYILHRSIGGGELPILPERVFSLIGSMHVIALAPPLSGILFAATSANAIVAWLGGMSLTRQTTALEALGISRVRYLWVPAWLGLVAAFLLMAALFTLGMLVGGVLYLDLRVPELGGGWQHAWELLTADIIDPPPERAVFRVRAVALCCIYALGIAGDAIAKGAQDKHAAEDVTVAMVRSVMVTTLWIVALELGSLVLIYSR